MRIGVVGGGVVGSATARAYGGHVGEVRVFDTDPRRATHSLDAVLECDLTFVCLPTPQRKDGIGHDLSAVEGFFKRMAGSAARVVLRSTVPIGTTRRLAHEYALPGLVHSPEFLTARTATVDAMTPARNLIGNPAFPEVRDAEHRLAELYAMRFPGVQTIVGHSDETEAVKLFVNGFFAVKIAYFNEVRALADALGLEWHAVLKGMLSDGRIAHSHTQVPGPDGKRGFGPDHPNACLPKDAAALARQIEQAGLCAAVTRGALERNRADRG